MSVNIFGSYGKSNSDIPASQKNYIDSKFISMLKHLQFKLDKVGDKMQGELDMGGNRVVNLADPNEDGDGVNKKYLTEVLNIVDERINLLITNTQDVALILTLIEKLQNSCTLSTNGLIPHHISPIDATGFIVSTSSILGVNHTGYKVFNPANRSSWRVTSDSLITSNFWIEVQCPFAVRVYRFSIQPAENTKLVKWKMQGRMDVFHSWEDLLFITEPLVGNTRVFTLENPELAREYWHYRFFIEEAEGVNPGLTYWQLYTINPVYLRQ